MTIMTIGNVKNLIKKTLRENTVVGDYIIMKQNGVWNAYTTDGEHAAGGTPDASKESLIAWAEDASADNEARENEWEDQEERDWMMRDSGKGRYSHHEDESWKDF